MENWIKDLNAIKKEIDSKKGAKMTIDEHLLLNDKLTKVFLEDSAPVYNGLMDILASVEVVDGEGLPDIGDVEDEQPK